MNCKTCLHCERSPLDNVGFCLRYPPTTKYDTNENGVQLVSSEFPFLYDITRLKCGEHTEKIKLRNPII